MGTSKDKNNKSLKDKMNLYAGHSVVRQPLQSDKEKTAQADTQNTIDSKLGPLVQEPVSELNELPFGDYIFKIQSQGFYLCQLYDSDPAMGKRSVLDHMPLNLSGILELSSIHQPEALHPEDVLFLDTETTGLSRGVATIPFLIGVCWLEGSALRTELIFIQSLVGEEAALDYLSELWQRFRYMVSYNGKAFDIPLIRNRMILHRKQGLKIGLHFDMLHIMRKIFVKGSIASYRQQEMEKGLLGYERSGDLPGAEIPQIYFDYVKYNFDRGLKLVFYHNQLDLLGLVLLFLEAVSIYRNRHDAPVALRSGLARILLRNREEVQALELLNQLELKYTSFEMDAHLTGSNSYASSSELNGLPSEVRYRDRMLLAWLYRRQAKYQKSADVLNIVVNKYNCPYAQMALAKLQEHRLGELESARQNTVSLIERLYPDAEIQNNKPAFEMGRLPKQEKGIYSLPELMHRLDRIQRKLT